MNTAGYRIHNKSLRRVGRQSRDVFQLGLYRFQASLRAGLSPGVSIEYVKVPQSKINTYNEMKGNKNYWWWCTKKEIELVFVKANIFHVDNVITFNVLDFANYFSAFGKYLPGKYCGWNVKRIQSSALKYLKKVNTWEIPVHLINY